MDPSKPASPPPAYTVHNTAQVPNLAQSQVHYVTYPTAPSSQYPQAYPGNTQPQQYPPGPYVSPNGIYYTPPPPTAYPQNSQGYTQAYVPGQTVLVRDNGKHDESDSLCACLMGALLCCCCLEMLH